jgi:hypothetical protein
VLFGHGVRHAGTGPGVSGVFGRGVACRGGSVLTSVPGGPGPGGAVPACIRAARKLAGLLAARVRRRAGAAERGTGDRPDVRDAWLAALDPGGGSGGFHREQGVAGGGLAGCGGGYGGYGSAGVGRQRGADRRCGAVEGGSGPWCRGGVRGGVGGAGGGTGTGFRACHFSWLHFISGGNFNLPAPVIFRRQSLRTGQEVKPCRKCFRSAGTGIFLACKRVR